MNPQKASRESWMPEEEPRRDARSLPGEPLWSTRDRGVDQENCREAMWHKRKGAAQWDHAKPPPDRRFTWTITAINTAADELKALRVRSVRNK
jgi:hypothetical protein